MRSMVPTLAALLMTGIAAGADTLAVTNVTVIDVADARFERAMAAGEVADLVLLDDLLQQARSAARRDGPSG